LTGLDLKPTLHMEIKPTCTLRSESALRGVPSPASAAWSCGQHARLRIQRHGPERAHRRLRQRRPDQDVAGRRRRCVGRRSSSPA
jgi:hypothetical protein